MPTLLLLLYKREAQFVCISNYNGDAMSNCLFTSYSFCNIKKRTSNPYGFEQSREQSYETIDTVCLSLNGHTGTTLLGRKNTVFV